MSRVKLYTDGACRGNPGPGGWGVVMLFNDEKKTMSGSQDNTTNNRMELLAAIKGLEALTKPCTVDLYTDSKYVSDGISSWIHNWRKKNWRTASGSPVKNKDLWQELDKIVLHHKVSWHWVKGHAGDVYNEEADMLATSAIDGCRL